MERRLEREAPSVESGHPARSERASRPVTIDESPGDPLSAISYHHPVRIDFEARKITCSVGDLVQESTYRRIGVERTVDAAHARGEQRLAVVHECAAGTGVDDDATL